MFTGIVEKVVPLERKLAEGENLHLWFNTALSSELKIDQSVSHNGVCLTVVAIADQSYQVTAIHETLKLSNLATLEVGDLVNLERGMRVGDRLDGHIVQGHVDGTAQVESIKEEGGSWIFSFEHNLDHRLLLHKGSVTVNGVSLTIVQSEKNRFKVAIIPYTYEHTNFNQLQTGDLVNIELDVLGKYVASLQS